MNERGPVGPIALRSPDMPLQGYDEGMEARGSGRWAAEGRCRLPADGGIAGLSAIAFAIALLVTGTAAWFAAPALAAPTPGQLYAFGNNRLGQLGSDTNIGTQQPNPTPLAVTLPGQDGAVVGAAGGEHHSLAVTEGGRLYSFGYNFYGQLGNATNNEYTFEPPLPPGLVTLPGEDGPVTRTAAGCDFSLAVTSTGQLYGFGENFYGQLGNETNVEVGVTAKANPTPTLVTLPGATGGVIEAAAGCFHSLALTSTGQLYAFGHNGSGELGYEPTAGPGENAHPTPTLVTLPGQVGPVVQIAAGGAGTGGFSLALTESGQLYSFGDNRYGQLGFAEDSGPGPDPSENSHPTPTLVDLPGTAGPIVEVAAGTFHTLALTESGRLYGFGSNRFGELGNTTNNGTEEANPTPTLVTLPGAPGPIAEIAAGYEDSFALTRAGRLYSFGWNWYGQLGRSDNEETSRPNPTPTVVGMPGGAAVSTVAAATDHSLATIGMVLTTTSLPEGTVGVPYEAALQAAGGEAPLRWSAGGLPPGLALDPTSGKVSGTPVDAACGRATCSYAATFTATDTAGMEASLTLPIAVTGNTYPLRVAVSGGGSGEVDSSPAGIEGCGSAGGTCEASYANGAAVTLTATPLGGSSFTGWSGGGCSGIGPCHLTLGGETTVTALFAAARPDGGGTTGPPPSSPPRPRPEAPDTKVLGARVDSARHSASFRFKATGRGTRFRCKLKPSRGKPRSGPCSSPRTYRHLRPGRYLFTVRAIGPGGADPTPARRRFRIRR